MVVDRKGVFILTLFVFLILGLTFVMASHNPDHVPPGQNKTKNDPFDHGVNISNKNNLTYGLCVANLTKEKRSCYKEIQETYKSCRYDIRALRKLNTNLTLLNITNLNITLPNNESNKTEIKEFRNILKNISKDCRDNYKEERQICMNSFKDGKLQCKQYKCKEDEEFIDGECIVPEPEEP